MVTIGRGKNLKTPKTIIDHNTKKGVGDKIEQGGEGDRVHKTS